MGENSINFEREPKTFYSKSSDIKTIKIQTV